MFNFKQASISHFPCKLGASLRKLLAAFGVIVSLSAASPVSATPFILFTDVTEGAPSLATSGVDVNGSTIGTDSYSFSGTLHIASGAGVLFSPPYSFLLLETGGGISDIVTVTTPNGFGGPGAVDWQQSIFVAFSSADGLISPALPTCTLIETGSVDTCHLFSQTGANILDIQVQSEVTELPEPTSIALVALALAGLVVTGRRRT
jgi:hypothetical protein